MRETFTLIICLLLLRLNFLLILYFFLLGCPCVCLADSAGCLASCFFCCYCPVAFSISIPFPCLKKKNKGKHSRLVSSDCELKEMQHV